MGRLKAVAINQTANPCSESSEKQMPCCDDVSQELKVEEITQNSFDFDSQPDLFQIAFIQFFVLEQSFNDDHQKTLATYYPPPKTATDYQVAYQVFLI